MSGFSPTQLRQMRKLFEDVLNDRQTSGPERPNDDWSGGVDGQWDVSALLSASQRRRQAMFPHVTVLPSESVLSFAKDAAGAILRGLQTFAQMDDMDYVSVGLMDGDEIWDFMDANPQHYGVAWKSNPDNARPTYDD